MATINCIDDLTKATGQEVFDQSARHLLKQNKRAFDPALQNCVYRTEDGLRCAAGVFLSDEDIARFRIALTCGWGSIVQTTGVKAHSDLIQKLQGIHDVCPVDEWLYELRQLARREGLNTDVTYENRSSPLNTSGPLTQW